MRKVLIITYYWPPSGGPGVQRYLKFAKYLKNFGWEPIIYTVKGGEYQVIDHSLEKDISPDLTVLKYPIFEPYKFYDLLVGRKRNEKSNPAFVSKEEKLKFLQKISIWVRGNFFIPDARMFWIKPSIKFLRKYLSGNKIDAIISTGPPHSLHLIALQLHKETNIPWLADFRDPWTKIYYYNDLMLTKLADKKHHRLEKEVLSQADAVTVIGDTMKEEYRDIVNRNIEVIANGYDEDDIYPSDKIEMDKKFSIVYIGTLMEDSRPLVLWRALSELVKENTQFADDLEIKMVGKIDANVFVKIKEYSLFDYLTHVDYLPHDEVSKIQQQSQVLFMKLYDSPVAKGIITGKLFEYLAAKRPIILIGPEDGDAAKIIYETGSGVVNNYIDVDSMKKKILALYTQYKSGKLTINSKGIEKYSRKNLTGKLAEVLDKISKNKS